MSEFAPCPSCRRHVRVRDEGCPFCGASLDVGTQLSTARPGVDARLGRAAALALTSLALSACGPAPPERRAALYGGPPRRESFEEYVDRRVDEADAEKNGGKGLSAEETREKMQRREQRRRERRRREIEEHVERSVAALPDRVVKGAAGADGAAGGPAGAAGAGGQAGVGGAGGASGAPPVPR